VAAGEATGLRGGQGAELGNTALSDYQEAIREEEEEEVE